MSKTSVRGCLIVLALGLVACSSAECPEGYTRVGDLCTQDADGGVPPDGTLRDGATPSDVGTDACPSVAETCNEIDDDCDGLIDEAMKRPVFYADVDGDGFGDDATATMRCTLPTGFVGMPGDCDDADPARHPGATETCDDIDSNCDGNVDADLMTTFFVDADGDGFGDAGSTLSACSLPAGHATSSDDCDDTCGSCHPGGTEICDGLDQNCDGTVDDGVQTTFYLDLDGDGFAASAAGSMNACTMPTGYTSRAPVGAANIDCFPGEALAFPGQPMFFTTPIVGAAPSNAYDYNCDMGNTRQYAGGAVCSGVVIDCSSSVSLPAFVGGAAGCGMAGTLMSSCSISSSGPPPGTLSCGARTTAGTLQPCH